MRHLMSPLDFSVEELDRLMDLAVDIESNRAKYAHACEGKKLATLFYEPSTRTRLSHEAAMLNLGGSVMGFSTAESSSASKGRAYPTPSARFPAMLISVLCATLKRARLWSPASIPRFRSSMPGTADTSIRPRHSPIF